MLCRKAGVSPSDVRGRITSHRARATIASQLYNAKEPMTLFELQAWLGHRSPETTQHYAQITPNTLTKAYTDAGYFARNVRTIEVLIDRGAVLNGTAAAGEPWQHYDLGHGYCSYTFFEQCPHRMACARCDFYIPKPSGRAQLLEAKSDIDRRLALIPLTDGERAAVEQDQQALGKPARRSGRHADPGRPDAARNRHTIVLFLLPAIFHITLDWLEDPELRRQATAELNKGESRNALARAMCFHRLGRLRDRAVEAQQHRESGLALVTAAIALWNTTYLDRALNPLRQQGELVPDKLLAHVAPVGWQHINLTGDYLSEPDASVGPDGFRPLRTTIAQLLARAG